MTTSTSIYAGSTRFTLELEFVTLLGNPHYLHHLATTSASNFPLTSFAFATSTATPTQSTADVNSTGSLLLQQNFISYLNYLLYWTQPAYLKFLPYPESSLLCLRLLQEERFRRDLCGGHGWDVCARLIEEMLAVGRQDGVGEGQGEKEGKSETGGEAQELKVGSGGVEGLG